jgi:hypothetical protein
LGIVVNEFQDKSKCVKFGRQDKLESSRIRLNEKLIQDIPGKLHILVGMASKCFPEKFKAMFSSEVFPSRWPSSEMFR